MKALLTISMLAAMAVIAMAQTQSPPPAPPPTTRAVLDESIRKILDEAHGGKGIDYTINSRMSFSIKYNMGHGRKQNSIIGSIKHKIDPNVITSPSTQRVFSYADVRKTQPSAVMLAKLMAESDTSTIGAWELFTDDDGYNVVWVAKVLSDLDPATLISVVGDAAFRADRA